MMVSYWPCLLDGEGSMEGVGVMAEMGKRRWRIEIKKRVGVSRLKYMLKRMLRIKVPIRYLN